MSKYDLYVTAERFLEGPASNEYAWSKLWTGVIRDRDLWGQGSDQNIYACLTFENLQTNPEHWHGTKAKAIECASRALPKIQPVYERAMKSGNGYLIR